MEPDEASNKWSKTLVKGEMDDCRDARFLHQILEMDTNRRCLGQNRWDAPVHPLRRRAVKVVYPVEYHTARRLHHRDHRQR